MAVVACMLLRTHAWICLLLPIQRSQTMYGNPTHAPISDRFRTRACTIIHTHARTLTHQSANVPELRARLSTSTACLNSACCLYTLLSNS